MELYDKKAGNIIFQASHQLDDLNVRHGFTTRSGGISTGIFSSLNLGYKTNDDDPENVRENFKRVCDALNTDVHRLVLSKQVHTDNIKVVEENDIGKGLDRPQDYEADGLITNIKDVTLFVFGADCLTILLHDPVKNVVGAVHAGWRGTALKIIKNAVEKMGQCYGCESENIRAALGPCISMCCFETDKDVPNAMTDAFHDDATPYIRDDGNGKFHVDLKGLNKMQLLKAGVKEEHIDISPDCTMCLPGKYWSHRYTNGKRGIQAGLICL